MPTLVRTSAEGEVVSLWSALTVVHETYGPESAVKISRLKKRFKNNIQKTND